MIPQDTIVALATPPGTGAISVIRVSGKEAVLKTSEVFHSGGNRKLTDVSSHTVHLGYIKEGARIVDQVLVTVFKAPHSYTGENVAEISCHGSPYIQQEIIQLFLRKGCRMAEAGEFTLRAFLNGKLDLSQAEAVADLIASENAASHRLALEQMRGGFSNEIKKLRGELLDFASLIELELDFAEEDVEFADKAQFSELLERIQSVFKNLIDSFALGNVIKNGIPIAIVGEPNVGKSTLLNALLNEERAIVSPIPGTTRDTIEDELVIDGVGFRFIDTAGIRDTEDVVESMGIRKTHEKIEKARLVIYLVDAEDLMSPAKLEEIQLKQEELTSRYPGKKMLLVINKIDVLDAEALSGIEKGFPDAIMISAKEDIGLETLKRQFSDLVNTGVLTSGATVISNTRHYNALIRAREEISKVQEGLDAGLSGDLLAVDIRQALYHLGEITGEITSDDLLGNIFANFCIGK